MKLDGKINERSDYTEAALVKKREIFKKVRETENKNETRL